MPRATFQPLHTDLPFLSLSSLKRPSLAPPPLTQTWWIPQREVQTSFSFTFLCWRESWGTICMWAVGL